MARVKEVLHAVVVGWRGDDHEIGIAISRLAISGKVYVERLIFKVTLHIFILYWRYVILEHLYLLLYHVYRRDMLVLGKQGGDA